MAQIIDIKKNYKNQCKIAIKNGEILDTSLVGEKDEH